MRTNNTNVYLYSYLFGDILHNIPDLINITKLITDVMLHIIRKLREQKIIIMFHNLVTIF